MIGLFSRDGACCIGDEDVAEPEERDALEPPDIDEKAVGDAAEVADEAVLGGACIVTSVRIVDDDVIVEDAGGSDEGDVLFGVATGDRTVDPLEFNVEAEI